jgi:hypothetical protein
MNSLVFAVPKLFTAKITETRHERNQPGEPQSDKGENPWMFQER